MCVTEKGNNWKHIPSDRVDIDHYLWKDDY